MDLERIKEPLMMAFMEDNKKNNGPSHITDLIIITIKSLMPSQKDRGVNIDYRRYVEEIKLWKHYRHGQNPSLMNIVTNIDSYIYWQNRDDTVLLRIIPIVLANEDYSITREEIIKNVLFTTGNMETIIEALLIAKLLHLIIMDEGDVIDSLKREIINLSQVEFMANYQNHFRAPMEDYKGEFSIDFERFKIYALNVLNLSFTRWFESLQDCIRVYRDNIIGNSTIGKCIGASLTKKYGYDANLANCYNSLGTYVYRLRKGRIDPEALKIEKYDLPDVFQFDEGDIFFHSLLNWSKVIKKEETDNEIITYLDTKLGTYKLVR